MAHANPMANHGGGDGAGGADEPPERRFGPYLTSRVIGRGGMGVVYEARHAEQGGRFALKVMRAEMHATDAPHGARFQREAAALAGLVHPNVVRIIDSGVERGRPYLVMELVEGVSLQRYLAARGPVAPAELASLFLPIFSAVAASHERAIIHRDLKPSNVMIAERPGAGPEPVLLDFGLSRHGRDEDDTEITRSEAVLGTVQYLSPEQLKSAKAASARSDQYALAVMLYECATGRRPFAGASPYELMHAIVTAPVPPPSALVRTLPAAFDAVVARAMSRDPGQRYPSVRAFGSALLSFADRATWARWAGEFAGVADLARAEERRETTAPDGRSPDAPSPADRPRGRRSRGIVIVSAALGLGLGLAAAFWPRFKRTPAPAPAPAPVSVALAPRPPRVVVVREPPPAEVQVRPKAPEPRRLTRRASQPTPPRRPPPLPSAQVPPAPAPRPAPALVIAPVAAPAPPADRITSPRPRSPVPRPNLPKLYTPVDGRDLRRVLARIEDETLLAGCSLAFSRGVTARLERALAPSLGTRRLPEIYPAATYYFIVREAAIGRTKDVALEELAAAHRSGVLRDLMHLPVDARQEALGHR